MSQIYVTDNGAKISKKGGRIEIISKKGLFRSIPIESVEGITIIGNAQVTTECIGECLQKGIQIQYLSKKGYYFGKVSSTQHVNTKRQRLQLNLTENKEFCLGITKNILRAKTNNQIVLVSRYMKTSNICLSAEIGKMKALRESLKDVNTLQEAMGYEGSISKIYFQSLNKLLKVKEFKFNGRTRRPPKDAFNSMLSLGYTILMNEIYSAVESKGLNPYFGFLHQDNINHPTLVSDLIEEWRAVIVDSTVMSLINGNEISIDNFFDEDGGVFFNKDGLKIFLNKLEGKLETPNKYLTYINYPITFRRAIAMQVQQLCHSIEKNNINIYTPLEIR